MFARREQYEFANEMLDQIIKQADDYDFHFITLEALHTKRLIYRKIFIGKHPEKLAENIKQIEQKYKQLEEQNIVANLHDQYATNPGLPLDEALLHQLNPLTQTITTQRLVNSIWAQVAEKKQDSVSRKLHRLNIVNLLEEKPLWKTIYPGTYLTALANYATSLSPQNDTYEFEDIIYTIHRFKPASEFIGAESFQLATYLQTYLYLLQGKFAAACTLEKEAEKKLGQYSGNLNQSYELTIYFNFALAHWVISDLQTALKWVNKILKIKNSTDRLDIQQFALPFAILLSAELVNDDKLGKIYTKVPRTNHLHNPLSDYYLKMAKLIKKWQASSNPKRKLIIQEIATEIKKPENASLLGSEDINLWIKHKTTGIPLETLATS
jgi:hypothetical protein